MVGGSYRNKNEMDLTIRSISTNASNVRQDVFPIDQWTITTRKGIIMQSKCTCADQNHGQRITQSPTPPPSTQPFIGEKDNDKEPLELCDVCRYHRLLPQLHTMPDMLFKNNLLRLEHTSGVGIEFNPLDALRLVEETKDPLKVAVADGWQSARVDCPFAKNIVKPFDWTFTTNYRGTLLSAIKRSRFYPSRGSQDQENQLSQAMNDGSQITTDNCTKHIDNNGKQIADSIQQDGYLTANPNSKHFFLGHGEDKLELTVEETEERIDVNKLKVREEILFYDDVTLYEDELADHGTAQYSVKTRVMPSSLFILARFYLRIDGVLARINDTRIYHELSQRYVLREYSNREASLRSLNLPLSTVINPSELMDHLPLVHSKHEKLYLPKTWSET